MKRTNRPFLVLLALSTACGAPQEDAEIDVEAFEAPTQPDRTKEAITDVEHSAVKRQSIGNCWLYATASWAESLHKAATGKEVNMSESYWTYWHWFDEITSGSAEDGKISTGGGFWTAGEIIKNYGVMYEGEFIADEATDEMSARQDEALTAMNEALKNGALKTADARADRELVRQTLDAAWGLDAAVVAQLDKVFGKDVKRTLRSRVSLKTTKIWRASTFKTKKATPTAVQGQPRLKASNLLRAIEEWQSSSYPTWSDTSKRDFLERVQRALHDEQPLILSWFVDFNSLDDQGRFFAPPAKPGHQGGHMVVLEDYQVKDVPGIGTLAAGTLVTDSAELDAALDKDAKIEFLRVKNSWGNYRADRDFVGGMPGYHDLYMPYLDGTLKRCNDGADGETDVNDCPFEITPFESVVFPPGY